MRILQGFSFILLSFVMAACTPSSRVASDASPRMLVREAIARAGGAAAIDASPVLAWSGRATIHAGGRVIRIEVDTEVHADGRATSRSWLAGQLPATARVLEIGPAGGMMRRDGIVTPAPEPLLAHERVQFGIYQLVRLTPLLAQDVALSAPAAAPPASGWRALRVARPGQPDAILWFDATPRLRRIELATPDPESGVPIAEVVDLDGEIIGAGIRWPRSIRLRFDGKPYFDLEIDDFRPRASAR